MTLRVPVVQRREDVDRFRDMVTPEQNLIGKLGILGLDLTPELARAIPGVRYPHGVVVAAVASEVDGAAGPTPGDVIYAVNGDSVRTLADLRSMMARVKSGDAVILHVGRQGQLRLLTVTLE